MSSFARKLATENRILANMDHRNSKPRGRTIIALDGKNLFWRESEQNEAVEMWEEGLSLEYMSEYFERPPMEVLILLLHCAEQGRIEWRKGSIYGDEA